jgi:hypothetical protein
VTIFLDDRKLLNDFKAGDRAALSKVYYHYVGFVETIVRNGFLEKNSKAKCAGYF